MENKVEIRQLYDNETDKLFYPISHVKAIVNDTGQLLDVLLNNKADKSDIGDISTILDKINGEII